MDTNQIQEFEKQHGLRFTWNVFPANYPAADNMPVPVAAMYSPFKAIDNLAQVKYRPVLCTKCGTVLNPYCRVNYNARAWACCMCSTSNALPPQYAEISPSNLCPELMPQLTTLEYIIRHHDPEPPILLFVIDTAILAEELSALTRAISQAVLQLPPETVVGVVTFSEHVFVHELAFEDCPKAYAFRGEREATAVQITQALGLRVGGAPSVSTPQPAAAQPPTAQLTGLMGSAHNASHAPTAAPAGGAAHRFLLPLSQCEVQLVTLLDSLQPAPHAEGNTTHRAARATGAALSLAITLLELACQGGNARVLAFSGGVCTVGPGKAAELPLAEPLRSHLDLQRDAAPLYKPARAFYSALGTRAANNGHVVDLFACCLDQVGLAEQQPLLELTGGVTVLDDSFTRGVFQGSLRRLLARDDEEQLALGFAAEAHVHGSPQLKVSGCLGHATSLARETPFVVPAKQAVGAGGTCAWRLGGLDPTSAVALCFQVQDAAVTRDTPHAYLQFSCKYRHASGCTHLRVTTVAKPVASMATAEGVQLVRAGFDQEVAAAVLTRLALHQVRTMYPVDVLRWLDKALIRLCARFATFPTAQRDPAQMQLAPQFSLLPQLVFHLRRSQLLRVFNCSPDETAFFRLVCARQAVADTLLMVQPALIAFSPSAPPAPVPLDVAACAPDRVLLLDTFFHVVVWYGESVVRWRQEGLHTRPEYEYFAAMLRAPLEQARTALATRLPAPRFIECVQGGSQSRFLMAKLNPSMSHNNNNDPGAEPPIFSDDVTLSHFVAQLRKMVASEKL